MLYTKKIRKPIDSLFLNIVILFLIFTNLSYAQVPDWRNAKNGDAILTNGYCDQPYVVVLPDRDWLCVFTTNTGAEGTGGQHIVSCLSSDQGKTWSATVQIEKPGKESASWVMPYITDYGRVYAFYNYNGDKIHELNGQKNIREDVIGWYCYKYSDDKGKTWSERYRMDVRKTEVDYANDWGGEVQIMWGIGKPVNVDNGMMFAFTKIRKYMLDGSEGWFFRCDNINTERDPSKLKWNLYPDSQYGIKNEKLGPINSEQNIFQLGDGTLYSMHRTISGHPAEAYSIDGGKSWSFPQVPRYENGIALKNPRACPRVWKTQNGKYLFWYHNNGGWNFGDRNPAWISGGIERNGKIIWGQPEILLYEDQINTLMSYPDLIEQDGKYWITETNKRDARCHEIPLEFMNMLWDQFDINKVATKGLVAEFSKKQMEAVKGLSIPDNKTKDPFALGFTIDMRLELGDLAAGQVILTARDGKGKSIILRTGEYGSVEIELNDGQKTNDWHSDPGLIPAYDEHSITVTVDNGPKIIQFVVDGVVCNGRDFRKFGWGRIEANMKDFQFNEIVLGKLSKGQIRPTGKLTNLRIYERALMNTEIIGIHRSYLNQ